MQAAVIGLAAGAVSGSIIAILINFTANIESPVRRLAARLLAEFNWRRHFQVLFLLWVLNLMLFLWNPSTVLVLAYWAGVASGLELAERGWANSLIKRGS